MAAHPNIENASTLSLGEFENASTCWNAEVRIVLEHHLEHHADGDSHQEKIMETLQYVRKFNNYANPHAVKGAKDLLQAYPIELAPFEVAQLNNLQIDTADEAFALIPSLKVKFSNNEDSLNELLNNLKRYQSS